MARVWLDVPYREKDAAKARGAEWDPYRRRWYAPRPGMAALQRWAPADAAPAAGAAPPAPADPGRADAAPPRADSGPARIPGAPSPSPPRSAAGRTAPARRGGAAAPRRSRAGGSAAVVAARLAARARPAVLAAAGGGLVLGAGLGGALLGWVGALVLGGALAAGAGWWMYRRGAAARWRMGAAGERGTGRRLAPLTRKGWTVLHDRALPRSRANVDHLVIGPDGTVFNVDSKVRRGAVRYDRRRRRLRIGKTSGYQLVQSTVWESERIAAALSAELARPVHVHSVLAVHRAKLPPWHRIEVRGVQVLPARDVRRWLQRRAGRGTVGGREVAVAAARVFAPYEEP